MRRKFTISQFEDSLEGLQGSISSYAKNNELHLLFENMYPMFQEYLTDVETQLKKVDMYESVKAALALSEALARDERYEEAEDVILDVNRSLMKASGTYARMAKGQI